jgi:hypothetical protein
MLAVVTVNTVQDIVDPNDQLTSLREAVEMTNDHDGADEIVFEIGRDQPATIRLEHGQLELTDAITITGLGRELLTIDAHHRSRIFNITASRGDFVIDGMTLTGGRGTLRGDPFMGGAIRSNTTGKLTLRNSAITNTEVAEYVGGAGIAASGDVAIESSIISGNIGSPGNIGWSDWSTVLVGGHVSVSFSTITENSSGGIRADGDVMIQSSTIFGNGEDYSLQSDDLIHGIPIIDSGGDVTVGSSTISRNSTTGVRANGNVSISSSTISGNRGGVYNNGFPVHIVGGVHAHGDVTITSSTISGNMSGGISVWGNATIKSSTVTGNLGDEFGGGLRHPGVAFIGNVTLENSIVAANQGGDFEYAGLFSFLCVIRGDQDRGDCLDAEESTREWTVRHSLIGQNLGTPLAEAPLGHPDSNGNLIGGPVGGAVDPRLGPLSDNGGPTYTHALLPDSPAINMGDPLAVIGTNDIPGFDQRGAPYGRMIGGRIDMGAFESRSVGDSNGDGVFNSSDLVKVFQAGKYEDDVDNNANFDEGDWNGDGDFDTSDLVFAFQTGNYVFAATPLPTVVDDIFSNDRDELLSKHSHGTLKHAQWNADLR